MFSPPLAALAAAVDSTSVTAWCPTKLRISTFLRYNYFDYNDEGATLFGGTAHWVLAGVNAMF